MIGIVVLSHGNMAEGMLHSVQFLHGKAEGVKSLCLYPTQAVEEFDAQLRDVIAEVDEGEGVLIFTDVNGGTPANRALVIAAQRADIEVISGVNLPLLLEALEARTYSEMDELCEQLMEVAPHSIAHASGVLRKGQPASAASDLDDLME